MIGQHHGFAAAIDEGDAGVDAYRPRPPSSAVDGPWTASVEAVTRAVAAAPDTRAVRLAELDADQRLPLERVVTVQLVDTVAHAWDVAQALGRDYRPEPALVAVALEVAGRLPDGAPRRRPGAPFAPVVDLPLHVDDWTRTLALLGRDARGRDARDPDRGTAVSRDPRR